MATTSEIPSVTITAPEGWHLGRCSYEVPGEGIAGDWHFLIRDDVSPTEAISAAVAAWAVSEDGIEKFLSDGHSQNLADAIDYLPLELWAEHGVVPVHVRAPRFGHVQHDEPCIVVNGENIQVWPIRF